MEKWLDGSLLSEKSIITPLKFPIKAPSDPQTVTNKIYLHIMYILGLGLHHDTCLSVWKLVFTEDLWSQSNHQVISIDSDPSN